MAREWRIDLIAAPPTACFTTPQHDASSFRLHWAPHVAPVRHGPEATFAPDSTSMVWRS